VNLATGELTMLRFVPVLLLLLIAVPRLVAGEPPNIILIMADDLGWGDVGFNGGKIIHTPHLDSLAADGLRFERFYAAAPVCSPTRGSCLTGRHPSRYGIFGANSGHLPPGEKTLAEMLRQHGYATGHFGKWHLGTLTKTEPDSNRGGPGGAEHFSPPWEHGFDVCFSTEAKVPTFDPMLRPGGIRRRTWWDPILDTDHAETYGTAYWSGGKRVQQNLRGDDSRIIMDRAVPFIRESAAAGAPFLAVIWFHAPHLPVVAGPRYTERYTEHDKYHQHYYGCVTAMDDQIGRLRSELSKLGVVEDTLVLFCSDNGPEGGNDAPGSSDGLRGRKRSLFEGGVRVPAFAHWPARIQPGSQTSVPACTSDYFPTLLDILNAEKPGDRVFDGMSLTAVFDQATTVRPKPIMFEFRGQLASIDGQFKIIHQRAPQQQKLGTAPATLEPRSFMMFDLQEDPAETTDIAGDHPRRLRTMVDALSAWRQSCRADWRDGEQK